MRLTARNVALTDQILAVLAEEAPLPISTSAVYAALDKATRCEGWPHRACWDRHVDYQAVYRILNRLARTGEVEKWAPSEDRRACLWRRLTIQEASRG